MTIGSPDSPERSQQQQIDQSVSNNIEILSPKDSPSTFESNSVLPERFRTPSPVQNSKWSNQALPPPNPMPFGNGFYGAPYPPYAPPYVLPTDQSLGNPFFYNEGFGDMCYGNSSIPFMVAPMPMPCVKHSSSNQLGESINSTNGITSDDISAFQLKSHSAEYSTDMDTPNSSHYLQRNNPQEQQQQRVKLSLDEHLLNTGKSFNSSPKNLFSSNDAIFIEDRNSSINKTRIGLLNKLTPDSFPRILSKFLQTVDLDNIEMSDLTLIFKLLFNATNRHVEYISVFVKFIDAICSQNKDIHRKMQQVTSDVLYPLFLSNCLDDPSGEIKEFLDGQTECDYYEENNILSSKLEELRFCICAFSVELCLCPSNLLPISYVEKMCKMLQSSLVKNSTWFYSLSNADSERLKMLIIILKSIVEKSNILLKINKPFLVIIEWLRLSVNDYTEDSEEVNQNFKLYCKILELLELVKENRAKKDVENKTQPSTVMTCTTSTQPAPLTRKQELGIVDVNSHFTFDLPPNVEEELTNPDYNLWKTEYLPSCVDPTLFDYFASSAAHQVHLVERDRSYSADIRNKVTLLTRLICEIYDITDYTVPNHYQQQQGPSPTQVLSETSQKYYQGLTKYSHNRIDKMNETETISQFPLKQIAVIINEGNIPKMVDAINSINEHLLKDDASTTTSFIGPDGYISYVCVHGSLTDAERIMNLTSYSSGNCHILFIASDICCRKNYDYETPMTQVSVVNFDFPSNIHRFLYRTFKRRVLSNRNKNNTDQPPPQQHPFYTKLKEDIDIKSFHPRPLLRFHHFFSLYSDFKLSYGMILLLDLLKGTDTFNIDGDMEMARGSLRLKNFVLNEIPEIDKRPMTDSKGNQPAKLGEHLMVPRQAFNIPEEQLKKIMNAEMNNDNHRSHNRVDSILFKHSNSSPNKQQQQQPTIPDRRERYHSNPYGGKQFSVSDEGGKNHQRGRSNSYDKNEEYYKAYYPQGRNYRNYRRNNYYQRENTY